MILSLTFNPAVDKTLFAACDPAASRASQYGGLGRLASGWDLGEGLRIGSAAGAATAMTYGTQLGTSADIE